MSRSVTSDIHRSLVAYIIAERKRANLTQAEVAAQLGRHQSFVATVESGQRRIDIVDLFDLGQAIGFDPIDAVHVISQKVLASPHSKAKN